MSSTSRRSQEVCEGMEWIYNLTEEGNALTLLCIVCSVCSTFFHSFIYLKHQSVFIISSLYTSFKSKKQKLSNLSLK